MKKNYRILLTLSCTLSFLLISTAIYLKFGKSSDSNKSIVYNTQELAVNNGKNNAPCYVAVDNKVYSIKQGLLWKNGEHTSSNGLAYCGKDLSDVIDQAPHGRSKLSTLTIVGEYKK